MATEFQRQYLFLWGLRYPISYRAFEIAALVRFTNYPRTKDRKLTPFRNTHVFRITHWPQVSSDHFVYHKQFPVDSVLSSEHSRYNQV